jgi:hypothetical protein
MKLAPGTPTVSVWTGLIRRLPWLLHGAHALYLAAGLSAFVLITPLVRDQPSAWHPLLLPFYDDVVTNPAGWWLSLEFGAFVVALTGCCLLLRPRRWALLVLGYAFVGAFGVGQMLPCWLRWTWLAGAALLAWRRRPVAAVLLLSGLLLAESIFAALVFLAYGVMVGGLPIVAVLAVLPALLLALPSLRRPRLYPLLPTLLLAALGLGQLAYEPSLARHHDAPASPGDCVGLTAARLSPLTQLSDTPAWVITDGPDGLYVAGEGFMVHLSDSGKLLHRLNTDRTGRYQDIFWVNDKLVGVGSEAVWAWRADRSDEQLFSRTWMGDRRFIEFSHGGQANGRALWSNVVFPVILRERDPRAYYYGELTSYMTTGLCNGTGPGRPLFVWDLTGVGELDRGTLRMKRFSRYGLTRMAVAVYGGRRFLYRANAFTRSVEVLSISDLKLVRQIRVQHAPRFLAVNPDETILASSNLMGRYTDLMDTASGRRLGRWIVGPRPRGVAYSRRLGRFVGVSACGVYALPRSPRRAVRTHQKL